MNTAFSTSASRAIALSKKAAVVAIGASMLSLVALSASASTLQSNSFVMQQRVDFDDLDLSQSADTERLYRRLRAASQQVCGVVDRAEAHRRNPRSTCAATALNNAVAEIDHPSLTALHTAKTETKLAQSAKSSFGKG